MNANMQNGRGVCMCEHTCTQWQASEGKGCRSMRIFKMHSSESCLVKRQRNRWFGGMTPFLIGHHPIPHHAEQQTEHGICLTAGSTQACSLRTEHLSPFKPDKQQEDPSLMHNSFVLITPWCPCPTLGRGGFRCHWYQQGMRWGSWHQMLEGEGFSFHCTPPGFTNWNLSNWGRGWCLEDVAKIFLIGNEGLQRISRELGSNRVTATECGPTCDLVAALPGSGAWWARRSAQPGNTGLCTASKEAAGAACRAAAKGDLTSQEQRSHGDAQQHGPASLQERYWDTRCLIAVPSPSGTHSFLPIKMPISKSRGTELLRHSQKTSS